MYPSRESLYIMERTTCLSSTAERRRRTDIMTNTNQPIHDFQTITIGKNNNNGRQMIIDVKLIVVVWRSESARLVRSCVPQAT